VRYRFGDFDLDTDRRLLTRGAEEIHLKPKAFQLLQLLVAKSPAVVTQQEIQEHLWPDTVADAGNVHSLISQIRDALADSERKIVRTSYGTGFYVEPGGRDASRPRFEVILGEQTIPLRDGTNLIGRDWGAQIRIDSASISRQHARIVIDDNRAVLEDLGSRNGTAVHGRRVAEPVELTSGDRIVFGTVAVLFRALPELRTTADFRDG
jgi:hypothetical protein